MEYYNECEFTCVKTNNKICCYFCEKSGECKAVCRQWKNNISYSDCFYHLSKYKIKDIYIPTATGVNVEFYRGYDPQKPNYFLILKKWFNKNISWRFKKYPPED